MIESKNSTLRNLRAYLAIFAEEDYSLTQHIFKFIALIGSTGHILFYFVLKYYFGTWESLPIRTGTALLYLSLLLLPRDKPINSFQKWYFEIALAITLPFVFNIFLIENHVSTYWAASVIFATIPYGLFSNPVKALTLYPISLLASFVVSQYIFELNLSAATVSKVVQLNFAAYFMVILLTIAQTIIRRAYAIIEKERHRSETLLHSILPVSIADQLKSNPTVIADKFESATILFADIVGFTVLSERLPPEELTTLLNLIFSRFDRLADKYGLEKIKTIGDAYMVAGGIPTMREDHAEAVVEMALDIHCELARFNTETGQSFDIRIGIHTGPVVAGVIGTKKFAYDVWGDTVNTASRMESHGIPGEIQVSHQVYETLKSRYPFRERGTIDIKGKGQMKAYLLQGREPI